MKNLIPRCFNELLALSITTVAIIAWAMMWWQA